MFVKVCCAQKLGHKSEVTDDKPRARLQLRGYPENRMGVRCMTAKSKRDFLNLNAGSIGSEASLLSAMSLPKPTQRNLTKKVTITRHLEKVLPGLILKI